MKISTEIESTDKIIGAEKAVEYVAKAGFDAWDLSMFYICRYSDEAGMMIDSDHPLGKSDYLKFARQLRRIGEDNGIVCNQSHAPFPSNLNGMEKYLKRAIECTAEAGGEICVIHPCNNQNAEENAKMYNSLLPFAKDYGVKIATENMFNWNRDEDRACFAACATKEDFKAHLDAVNDDFFVACVDIGHCEIMGEQTSAESTIRHLGDKVCALHIHDNDLHGDCHQIPFSKKIDFAKVAKALKDINYKGYFTLEASTYLKDFTADNVFDGLCDLKNAARKFADMFEQM